MVDLPRHRKRRHNPSNPGSADPLAGCRHGELHAPDSHGVGYCTRCGVPVAGGPHLDDQVAPLRYDDDPDLWWFDQ